MIEDMFAAGYPSGQNAWDESGRHALKRLLQNKSQLSFPVSVDPKLSIVVVLYNKAHLSLLCLHSILANVHVPYELIIVDNKSVDESRTMLAHLHGPEVILNDHNTGFGEACMQAARKSRGRIILFLNNDALIMPGAVAAALKNFGAQSVGAVGGKILLSDGTLQEAGSIIWSDGTALGYGRLADPSHTQYQFRRPVDYCSGAFLFTPRELFLGLGGFEPCYAPAYYEDTDYCLKVWQAGFEVMYEPEAVIRHYESASSGGNQNAAVQMEKNRRVFVARWRKELESHYSPAPANILRARIASRQTGLRIIYIDDRVPHHSLGAGYPRSNDILRCLVQDGHRVTCVPFNYPAGPLAQEYAGIPREVEILNVIPDSSTLYRDYLASADVVWVSRPHNMGRFLDELASNWELTAKLVYDAEAIFSQRDRLYIALSGKRLPTRIIDTRIQRELVLSHAADAVTVVSDRDGQLFREANVTNLHTLGHALSPAPTMRTFGERRKFLFIGAVHSSNTPNGDSLRYFCREIWPQIRQRTGAEFVIAGFGTDGSLDVCGDGIRILGAVENLRPLFEEARVFVIPTRYAGGIPFKAHQAAAHGLPMVVTPLIMDQLGWQDGHDLLTGYDARAFADQCCELYGNQELWNKLRVNALTRILLDFSPDEFSGRVRRVLESIVQEDSPPRTRDLLSRGAYVKA